MEVKGREGRNERGKKGKGKIESESIVPPSLISSITSFSSAICDGVHNGVWPHGSR